MGQHVGAYSLYGVKVDAGEWLDEQHEDWADGKAEAMKASPRLRFLSASPHYDSLPEDRTAVIGLDLDGLDPAHIIEAIRSAPLCLKTAGLEGVPMLHTLVSVD